MPQIEELPVVGQREWNARQSGTSSPQPNEDLRKKGFFDRLTGRGRRTSGVDTPPAAQGDESREEAPLPVFFGRERR
jgi:hypothetical protein